jgi:hypothetical protein
MPQARWNAPTILTKQNISQHNRSIKRAVLASLVMLDLRLRREQG